jgi:hypothetical protein
MGVVRVACRVRVVGGIAFSTLGAGIVTPPTLADVCAQTVSQLSGVPLMFVADFRRPSWAMRVVDLNAFFDDCSPEVEPPAALVVSPDDYRLFRAHAWDVAQGGILRKVFTDYPQAVAWTLRRRALVSPAKTVP